MNTIRIALAQINPTVGDLSGNTAKVLAFLRRARSAGADVVVFPELAVTGYPPEDLLLKPHFIRDNLCALKNISRATKGLTAVVGFVDADKHRRLYNAAAVIMDGKVCSVYHKNRLPNYGVFDEKRYFTPGTEGRTFTVRGVRVGVSICEDIWTEDSPCRLQARAGAQVLLNLSASPYHHGKVRMREELLKSCARKMGVYFCYCNLIGGQDELVFDGASFFVDSKGKIFASGRQFEEDLVVADLAVGPRGQDSGPLSARYQKDEEIYRALVLGTRDYVRKNGFQKVVLGVSGGVDSALVAVLACDALGKENVLAVSMPSVFSSSGTKRDARKLAQNLGVSFREVPIQEVFEEFLRTLKPFFKGAAPNIAEENLQARIRGNILMALSNKFGHLVLTTGNKSEISVGYCTLYGDMAGGFAVIKDVPKTLVYRLVNYRNAKAGLDLIPQSIIIRPPTAELKKNQKDQDSLPPYEVLDPILESYVEADKGFEALAKGKAGRTTVKKMVALVDRMEYKRRQAPPGIKITPKAFGKDRRLPITNRYRQI